MVLKLKETLVVLARPERGRVSPVLSGREGHTGVAVADNVPSAVCLSRDERETSTLRLVSAFARRSPSGEAVHYGLPNTTPTSAVEFLRQVKSGNREGVAWDLGRASPRRGTERPRAARGQRRASVSALLSRANRGTGASILGEIGSWLKGWEHARVCACLSPFSRALMKQSLCLFWCEKT